ncbi:MAG TPA: DUF4192 family protein [Microbacteriaceae bacterium]|nr:DUF4192 family protein [Microbacteriaceae bacterium]
MEHLDRGSPAAGPDDCAALAARIALWENALRSGESSRADVVASLTDSIGSPCGRDVALLQVAFGRQAALLAAESDARWQAARRAGLAPFAPGGARASIAWAGGSPADAARVDAFVGDLVAGHSDIRPDPARMRRGIDLLVAVTRAADAGRRAQAHSMIAWLQWAGGRPAEADRHVGYALEAEPGHVFARLLRGMFRSGWRPHWLIDTPVTA